MLMEFTETVGRYTKGQVCNYPQATWRGIAASAKRKIKSFARPIESPPSVRQANRLRASTTHSPATG